MSSDGTILICQHKTKRNVRVQFSATTIAAISEFQAEVTRELIWPICSTEESGFYRTWSQLSRAAGLKGPFKQIRKSAATAVELIRPNAATPLLGHANRATTEGWYINHVVNDSMPKPPEIRL